MPPLMNQDTRAEIVALAVGHFLEAHQEAQGVRPGIPVQAPYPVDNDGHIAVFGLIGERPVVEAYTFLEGPPIRVALSD